MLRIITFLFFIFLACDNRQSLDKDLALAYAELRMAEHEHGETEDGKAARFQILQKHALDLSSFEDKMERLKEEDANWLAFQKEVVAILDSINKENRESKE